MMPLSLIGVGDIFRTSTGSEWVVLDKNLSDKVIKVQMLSNMPEYLNRPFWKSYRASMFHHRVHEAAS